MTLSQYDWYFPKRRKRPREGGDTQGQGHVTVEAELEGWEVKSKNAKDRQPHQKPEEARRASAPTLRESVARAARCFGNLASRAGKESSVWFEGPPRLVCLLATALAKCYPTLFFRVHLVWYLHLKCLHVVDTLFHIVLFLLVLRQIN